jgi:transcriptional regulator GlxA family with amidase domain
MSVYESASRHRRQSLTPVGRAVERLLSQPFADDNAQQLADRFGVSREHFTRVFSERTGLPPARYLANARAQRAVRLLRGTGLTVEAIARQVGVRDAAALGRLLRRETGKPPTAWRKHAPQGRGARIRTRSSPVPDA